MRFGRGSAPDNTGEAYSASPDPLAGKGGGAPGMAPTRKGGPPGRRGVGREGEGAGEGQNCCHQMSDFTAKMRGRAIILTYLHVLTSVVL